MGAGDVHVFAVLGHGAAGELDALGLKHGGQLVVGEGMARILLGDQFTNFAFQHQQRRVSALGPVRSLGEEEAQLDDPLRGVGAADFDRVMRDFAGYPQRYSPQVLQAKVLSRQGNCYQVLMRVRQKHVLTVVMDTAYGVTSGRLDATHGYSISRSTRIAEIDSPGEPNERALGAGEEHGYLWRLNTYWSYEERDGGLYMQIESVSLTRSIPTGLGWLIGPFVKSVPRESLEFTLRATCDAVRKEH